jgi:hypothetical protein
MINGNASLSNDGVNGTTSPWFAPNSGSMIGSYPAGSPANMFGFGSPDGVRPAWYGNGAGGDTLSPTFPSSTDASSMSGISGLIAQLSSTLQQAIGQLTSAMSGSTSSGNTTGTSSNRNTGNAPWNRSSGAATFQNVSLSSTGDPHLAVSGTEQNANGTTSSVSSKFDSMSGHDDLFSTRDFGDGFRVSTTVTTPSSNGITQNASATATMDGGRDSVTMTNNGSVSVTSNGGAVALSAGQSITLGSGEQVSESASGAVSITDSAFGKNLTTTFTNNGGGGVDVTASGNNVTLAGDLVTGGSTPVATARYQPNYV